jgi:hypothetical protein
MSAYVNPALQAFADSIGEERDFVEIRIRRLDGGRFELRHAAEAALPANSLEPVDLPGLRRVSRITASGAFRPNKAAPGLRGGWMHTVRTLPELGLAIDALYPGAVPDWFAGQLPTPPVTHFKEFTARQTGLYRITQILPAPLAARTVQACCGEQFCLRRRLWTTEGVPPDDAGAKSGLPCLEPCALLLDLARRAMKLEQEEKHALAVSHGDLPVLVAALERALEDPSPAVREGNTMDPANPRRIQLLLEVLRPLLPKPEESGAAPAE